MSSLLFFMSSGLLNGQALFGDHINWNDLLIYKDAAEENIYYYIPGPLSLKMDAQGKPDFLLIQTRYLGTACADDQGDARFFNLLSFTVQRDNAKKINQIDVRNKFGKNAKLIPLPIRHISTNLVTYVQKTNGKKMVKLSDNGVVESGVNGTNEFWTERSYSMKLQNYEAELIAKQIEANNLNLSLAYSYIADGLRNKGSVQLDMEGEAQDIEDLLSGIDSSLFDLASDTIIQPYMAYADAMPIEVDIKQWPDLIRKIDLNEEIPPTYPAIEVRCYDFNEQLNPDLYIKKIEIHTTGVNNRPVKVSTKFYKSKGDIHTKHIYFPYAVKMDRINKFRTVTYTEGGQRTNSDWTHMEACRAMIDITTSNSNQQYVQEEIEIEWNTAIFDSLAIGTFYLELSYDFKAQKAKQLIPLNVKDKLPYRSLYFWKDKNSKPQLLITYTDTVDGVIKKQWLDIPSDRYVYVHYDMFR